MREEYDLKVSLYREALDVYREEYAEITRIKQTLESKAQGLITVAGIFIAAVFTFIREFNKLGISDDRAIIVKFLLFIAILSLIACILFSLSVVKIMKHAAPLPGDVINKMVHDLLNNVNYSEISKRMPSFKNDKMKLYTQINDSIKSNNIFKTKYLWPAQLFLVLAIVTVSIITIIIISC